MNVLWTRDAEATDNPRPRCRFGRPHTWSLGWLNNDGRFVIGWVKCWTCGQVERD